MRVRVALAVGPDGNASSDTFSKADLLSGANIVLPQGSKVTSNPESIKKSPNFDFLYEAAVNRNRYHKPNQNPDLSWLKPETKPHHTTTEKDSPP